MKTLRKCDYIPPEGEINEGKILVETAGYIPADAKIESMILAGQRLVDFRQGYEFGDDDDIPDDYIDPTRNPGFDLSDASILEAEANARLIEQKQAAKAAKEALEETKKPEIITEGQK